VVGDNVFATGYQGRTAMLALDSGQVWWSHDMSSYRGLAVDGDNLYVTLADGIVVAMRQRDGAELWRNDKIKRRGLSTPVVNDTAIAVADYQGYVHWLDKTTGELVARVHVKKQRVSNPPVGDGNTVVVLTDGGSMAAYRSTPRSAPAAAAAAAPPASDPAVVPSPATLVPAPAPAPAEPVPATPPPPPPQ
jgi:outer membrane protein assembly factor BamB